MSNYQHLSETNNNRQQQAALADDANFALFFNNTNSANHSNGSGSHASSSNNDSSDSSSSVSYSNGRLNLSTTIDSSIGSSNITMDADDSTMEVPLLLHNNNNDFEHTPFDGHQCRCEQPGFAANLRNKSIQEAKCKMLAAISLCCVFMFVEFLGGLFAGSLAIMTDAAHLASDCISFIIGLVAIWLGSRPPDGKMSFGYKRMEVMGALVSILGIWILTATLVIVAIQRILLNDYDLDANTMMIISGIGIIINIVMIFILHGSLLLPAGAHGHSHSHAHSHDTMISSDLLMLTTDAPKNCKNQQLHTEHLSEKNLNLRAAIIHVIGDLVQSIGVFLAAVLIKFYPQAKFADPLCTLLFSVIVILTTVRLFKESVGILMDAVPNDICLHDLQLDLLHIDGVKSTHHVNVWNHTTSHKVLMAHLVIDILSDSNQILDKATQLMCSKYNIKHCTIQIERTVA